ncbi:uncharacterized protein A4U43_C04F9700 [Asparagus officinalis]|uniref:GAGA-binding transcriptional activator n=1 Tax=Asparagus officinalis TaxID=4686 RepID=A0A5P1F4G2_ASPOF|nr:protein BASIC PENTACYSTEINE7-like [Asparagus officinalis]ONK71541.1 uncharacterized protein A4U43_C04F9700 [Asparagus officinalis]
MEGKGRFSARKWVFSDQTNPSNLASSVPEGNAPGYQPSFLKMSAYTNRSSIVNEPDNEASSMEFPWFPQRSFFSPTRDPSPEHTKKNKEIEAKPAKVRIATKALRPKEPKKPPAKKKGTSISTGKREKRNQDATIEGTTQDFSGVPAPVCTCTGVSRQCYRWGSGGWQSYML